MLHDMELLTWFSCAEAQILKQVMKQTLIGIMNLLASLIAVVIVRGFCMAKLDYIMILLFKM